MSIPIFRPKTRAQYIEWNILPNKRNKNLFNKYRSIERNQLQNVFMFWLLLFVFVKIGFLYFQTFGGYNTFSGLRVSVPSSSYANSFIFEKSKSINIWIDRYSVCIINDKVVKQSIHLPDMLNNFKNNTKSNVVYLYIDRMCTMDFPQLVINEINKIGFNKIVFITKSSLL